jgi:hypothetical protein
VCHHISAGLYTAHLVQILEQEFTAPQREPFRIPAAKSFFLSSTTIPDGLGKDAMCENKWFGHKFQLEADIMPTR